MTSHLAELFDESCSVRVQLVPSRRQIHVPALSAKARAIGVDLRATAVTGFARGTGSIEVTFADGGTLRTRLLVGADGARSQIREQEGIATHGWDYDQSAIVSGNSMQRKKMARL